MPSLLPAMQVELQAALDALEPELEGQREFFVIRGLSAKTNAEVGAAIVDFERRKERLADALEALGALAADGYPAFDARTVDDDVVKELREDADRMLAALARYAGRAEAVTGRVVVGSPQP